MNIRVDELDLEELFEELELGARIMENPMWEQRDFGDLGFFIGPKNICDLIEEALEEV